MKRAICPLLILAMTYLPFSWLLFIDYPHTEYWWSWVRSWPVLPGLPALLVARPLGLESSLAEVLAMGVAASCWITTLIILTRTNIWLRVTAFAAATIYGIWIAMASHAVFVA
jgi:hypothetical protein